LCKVSEIRSAQICLFLIGSQKSDKKSTEKSFWKSGAFLKN
jgi:hypothetical protein